MTTATKGRFTFRFAAVFFALSALFSLVSLQEEVPIFGHVVSGAAVAVYHLVYTALFGWLAVGLWNAMRSAYYVLFATTVVYTLDRVQFLLGRETLIALVRDQFNGHEEVLQSLGMDFLMQTFAAAILTSLLCWWGFVAYAYYRRSYFGIK